ncbi:MAG: site-specific integrase [Dysgonomonas sp.]|uniref:site-specific integrase n=1 Tax=Dysgonomonas sp. TaxID=1891233 RepID=UPI0039E4CD78
MNAIQTTFSLLYVIRKHRLLKNGEASIYLRITVNGEVADITTKRSVRPEMWDQRRECSLGKLHRDKELNHYLETIKTRLYQIHREFEIDGKRITAKALRDSFYGKDEDSKTLGDVYREHNKKCRALIGIDYSRSTVEKFDTSLSHLIEYIQYQYGKDDILLSELNCQFVTDFDFYLKTVRKCQNNSSIKHLKNLKKVVRIALANDWIKKDPFFGIQFKHEETHVEFLTQEELERIMNKEFELPRLELVRDIFVFCSFTALAFIDVKNLTLDHLMKDNNGALWIRKPRQKTGNMSNIPVLSVTKKLIDKYKDHPECIKKDVLLPVLSNQKLNSYLKEIADLCGIKKKLTTHVARHTAATIVFLANNVSMENVAKILGHSSTKMTQHYAKVLDSSIMRDMSTVEKCFTHSEQ